MGFQLKLEGAGAGAGAGVGEVVEAAVEELAPLDDFIPPEHPNAEIIGRVSINLKQRDWFIRPPLIREQTGGHASRLS
jgi:hypothetical protein